MESKMNPQEARAALAAVEQSRSDMADRLVTPWWYHPILGLLCGGFGAVAGSGARLAVVYGALAAFGIGIFLLATSYRRLTGVWADGQSGGPRARRSVAVAGIVGVVVMGGGAIAGLGLELWWPSTVAGALIAVLTVVWGRRYDTVLRAEMRESA